MSQAAERPRVEILTFGCRVNQYETQVMRERLAREFELASGDADLYLVSACTVTALAEKKARQAIRRLRREHPDAKVVLVGCLADAVAQGLTRVSDADLLGGNAWKGRVNELVSRALDGERGFAAAAEPVPLSEERAERDPSRARAFLKVQDGCDLRCTFCRTHQVRGPCRSKPIPAAVEEARRLVASGCPEIVVSGINLAAYRTEVGGLPDLVREFLRIEGLRRLRLGSINASGVGEGLIAAFADDRRACPHFHMPLQSGDDDVLRLMARGYTASSYVETVARVRRAIPDATFGADVIVGFPGEDDAAFGRTCSIVEEVGFANLHVFRYSPRKGTPAMSFPRSVPEEVKRERASHLEELAAKVEERVRQAFVGSEETVLVEERKANRWRGYTRQYLDVHFAAAGAVGPGMEVPVKLAGTKEGHLEGVTDHRTGMR